MSQVWQVSGGGAGAPPTHQDRLPEPRTDTEQRGESWQDARRTVRRNNPHGPWAGVTTPLVPRARSPARGFAPALEGEGWLENVDRRTLPLGVFDSGLGGLTVVHALRRLLPGEHLLYLGDTARVPYGTRSADTILRYARTCAGLLVARGVKALVLACNTVSAVALEMLRAELDLPVLGVIEPGARAAHHIARILEAEGDPRAGRIGVLGTASTIRSGAYPRAVGALSSRLEVFGSPAPLLVPLVEEGWLDGPVPELAVERYVAPLIEAEVGVIVLGCTHYPLLKETIERVARRLAGKSVRVVDSAEATAEAASRLLADRDLLAGAKEPGALELMVTDVPASFEAVASRFLQETLPRVDQVEL
jgi:glutamate racemase